MSILEAIILGIIQGLTEFLPISSTAHLTIAGKLLGLISPDHPEQWTAFVAVIQLGTLAAVLLYFAQDIRNISLAFLRENYTRTPFSKQSNISRLGWFVVVGSIPIGIIGLTLKKTIEGSLTKDTMVIAISLIVLAVILYIAERTARFVRGMDNLTFKDAVIVGCAQVFALIPGASRSGSTITAGLFSGMTRETAARFSFLLSIPAVLASGLLELKQEIPHLDMKQAVTLSVATLVSGVIGYLTIAFLLRYLKTHTVLVFVIYRIALGIALLIFPM